ncbi:RNA degradosome polyphosphate kinase [Bacillus shivajii]|uniref:RNA degradosome polyphosphate kinase n=1 Tax=Bacillus shivajii TaxID=1983719 RepID=UPI001CFC3C10|nr:RNA degradosome polyphosphate kinase [Bacillus shivajii]UCZ55266.1 RNA degradosome polyphosphate kinase [Bacillus shivajii]
MNNIQKYRELNKPVHFNNRELSWLAFNKRVLEEAIDESNPLLERLKFLAIFSSNLDEFFMVRVAGLKDQVKAGFNKRENKAGLTPRQQLKEIREMNSNLVTLQDDLYMNVILPKLKSEGIHFLSIDQLTRKQYDYVKNRFEYFISPVLTPVAIDAYRPFPMLMNKSLNLAVVLQVNDTNKKLAIVQVPSILNRTIPLPSSSQTCNYILLEDVIRHFIARLFQGNDIVSVSPFRITRNADLTIHEEGAQDLLKEIEKELKKRKWGAAVRLEVQKQQMDKDVLSFLMNVLELKRGDVYEVTSPIDLSMLFSFYEEISNEFEHLTNESYIPQPALDLNDKEDLFETVLKKDVFLHHPYESFQPIVDLITIAAVDPNVLAIKQTLYRVSGDSPIIKALEEAAYLGKQVTVLVELKARFDEERNIQWAKKLEKAGIHVIYGIVGLKTHSKITLIIRQHDDSIQRFVHLSTGNYNDHTAKFYTDMGLITSDEQIAIDASNIFNHLSGCNDKPNWNVISTAPFEMRETFLKLIDDEIAYQKKYKNGKIIAKMNSLTDKPIIMKLYEASCEGVKIELIVRGICCLRPGITGVSENITVRSIVDRFLEHSRVYYFHQNGKDATYLSSADWMTRNMEKRVEILFPIHSKKIKQRIKEILRISLEDNVKARYQMDNGEYEYVKKKDDAPLVQSQIHFCQQASNPF